MSKVERLWRKVLKTDSCWLWEGAVNDKGYGLIGSGKTGKLVYVHRLAWELEHGPIPEGLELCHHCDTRRCVRTEHMFLGTHHENILDKAKKGRSGIAILTEVQIREVMHLRSLGIPRREIVAETGINVNTLKDLLRGKNWSHITGWSKKTKTTAKLTKWWTYVLCSLSFRDKYYVGVSKDPQRRLKQHNGEKTNGARYTASYRPWIIHKVYGPLKKAEAFNLESQLKIKFQSP
jgi:predicted GIY-YIG superfamily endonuclease